MKIQVNLFILFYISLCSGSWLGSFHSCKAESPAQLHIVLHDRMYERGKSTGFRFDVNQNFSLADCQTMNLCPGGMKHGEEFIKQLLTLDMFEVLAFILNKNKNELRYPVNDTAYWYESPSNRVRPKVIGKMIKPSDFHYADKYKLIITVPIYFVCSVIVYLNKSKLPITTNFPNISRILIKYLSAKLVFGILYLAYLVLFDDFGMQILGNFKILAALTIFNYVLALTSFLLVVLFAFGYCTSFFTFTNRSPILWKVCGLTSLYGIQSFPKVFYELQNIENARDMTDFFKESESRLPSTMAVYFIILYIVIICAVAYIAYHTYKHSHKRDARFLFSFHIILAACVVSPLIVVPYERSAIPNFIKNKYLLNDRGAQESYSEGVHIPDVIELFVIGALIYVWRDLEYVENDGDVYDMLDNSESKEIH